MTILFLENTHRVCDNFSAFFYTFPAQQNNAVWAFLMKHQFLTNGNRFQSYIFDVGRESTSVPVSLASLSPSTSPPLGLCADISTCRD